MQPCEGRAAFAWPEVVFPSGAEAGAAVALALQEVTCSFTVAPSPSAPPTPTPAPPAAPLGVQVLGGNASLTIQWLPPSTGKVVDYLVHCRPATGGDWIESTEGVSTTPETVIEGLQPGVAYDCEVAASDGVTTGPYTAAAASTVVLGIPGVPGQPRVEPMDGAARLSVDPVSGGAPVEQYGYDCTSTAGHTALGAGPGPTVVVTGLTNGETFQCVAYTQNRIGRSASSPASASFMPCSGLFNCNPWAVWVVGGGVLLAILGGALLLARLYARRNRVWVTAQVDGGANRPLGWGPQLGIGLDQDEAGWYVAQRPLDRAPMRVRYQGKNRFLVQSSAGIRDVHEGDPASIREGAGDTHQLILRSYRRRLGEEAPTSRTTPADDSGGDVVARLDRPQTSSTAENTGLSPDTNWIPADPRSTPEDAA
jgi:hypothetical protein